jgi:NADPH:quinone reductase-like Zn-dependent oxidoreductase
MKAIAYHQFGTIDVLQLETLPKPNPDAHDVLVSVRATSVNVIDSRVRDGKMGILVNNHFPKVPGSDLAGIVETVGSAVKGLHPGDAVFGATNSFVGGAFAEYAVVPETALALKPGDLTFADAAALPITGLAALYSLRELGEVRPDSRVLIYGSSGGAGLYAIQLAKILKSHVTAVCGTSGVEVCRKLGSDIVLDYKLGEQPQGPYDIIIDFSGRFPFDQARLLLAEDGRYIDSSPTIPHFIGSKIINPFRSQKDLMLQTEAKTKDLEYLASLVEAGQLKVTIARTFLLAEAREAFRIQEAGGVLGKIVVTVPESASDQR